MLNIPRSFSCIRVKMICCFGAIGIPISLQYNGSTKVKED